MTGYIIVLRLESVNLSKSGDFKKQSDDSERISEA
jgi:hypothetical protein